MSEPSPIANTPDLVAVHSSRLWAAFHLNITRLLFPATMSADAIGVSTSNVYFWLTPWQRIDEHLPLSHITEVTHVRGFFWDGDQRRELGRAQSAACLRRAETGRLFVEHLRARLNEVAPAPPLQPQR
jgi:hypothetical protein